MLLDEDELLRVDERIDEVFHRAEPLVLSLEPKVFFLLLLGICFSPRRAGNGPGAEGSRGVRGSGGSEGREKDEG